MELPKGYILIKESEFAELLAVKEVLIAKTTELSKVNEELLAKIIELEARLNKNSNNSSKPPSSDGPCKEIKNSREKSGLRPGAQAGHKGNYLKVFEKVDQTVMVEVKGRCDCGKYLEDLPVERIERRTVADLPEKLINVTEYQVEIKRCRCGKIHEGNLPYHNRVQYGERFKALLTYLNIQQQIPYDRLQEFSDEILKTPISDGLINSSIMQCSESLTEATEQIKIQLLASPVAHVDETGMRSVGKTSWIHTFSTQLYTHFFFHEKRGREAMDTMGLLPNYNGIIVHDRWASYDKYNCGHAFCNAHLLRELKFISEEFKRPWASELKSILKQANEYKKKNVIDLEYFQKVKNRIGTIVDSSIEIEEIANSDNQPVKKRGRKKNGKPLSLLYFFKKRIDDILKFLSNPDVPFDNNQAERDIRMVKLKQKISGCFRSKSGAKAFCTIRGYISTVRKQGLDVWDAIWAAIRGTPVNLLASH